MKNLPLLILLSCCVVSFNLQAQREGSHSREFKEIPHTSKKTKRQSYQGFKNVTKAVAHISPTSGNTAKGIIWFKKGSKNRVRIIADIEGLKPNSKHGFHVHEFGDCSSGNGKSTGGHYNPQGHPHGSPGGKVKHAGDLGNLQSDSQGKAHFDKTFNFITISGRKNPILGRGIIIHAGADDLKTQPTGNAGSRIACGVITIAK